LKWIQGHHQNGIGINTKMIQIHARNLALQWNLTDFKGGVGWCYRFMKRHGLSMRTKTKISQKMPQEYEEKILSFHRFIIQHRKKTSVELSQIANMDETPLTFDVPSNRTVAMKGAKTVTIKASGHEKMHYTVVLSCCADGTKLNPMIIFKRKTMPKPSEIPPGVVVHVHDKGWMDEAGMKLWINRVWERRKGALLKKSSLLVLDQFSSHLKNSVKEKLRQGNTELAVIPGGLTSQLQPLDVSINKPFKVYMREEWNKWMMDETQHEFTPKGALKLPTIKQVCQWIKQSWSTVREDIIVKSFKKCGISNTLDCSEDHLIYEEDNDDDEEEEEEESSDDDFQGF
jgi:hypothetical protein